MLELLRRVYRSNLGERVVWTFAEVFLSVLTASEVFAWEVSTFEVALGSALGAAIVPLKEFARAKRAEHG